MKVSMNSIEVYVETGDKKVFASALDWPGLSRSSRDQASALQALIEYGHRYAAALKNKGIEFISPGDAEGLRVIEQLEGNATTDFGAPAVIPDADKTALGRNESERQAEILQACWLAFDHAVLQAIGKNLRKGPRGGGRDLEDILEHVIGADQEYLRRLGYKHTSKDTTDAALQLNDLRKGILEGIQIADSGGLPAQGPRGGSYWPVRYFIRRVAWHALDHAWEIEDRLP